MFYFLHLHKKIVYFYFESQSKTTVDSLFVHLYRNVMICKLNWIKLESTLLQFNRTKSKDKPEIVAYEDDDNRKITVAEALKKLMK